VIDMDWEAIVTATCFGAFGGLMIVAMVLHFRIQDRDSTKRQGARPGTQPFKPESKVKPWRKSDDMLKKE